MSNSALSLGFRLQISCQQQPSRRNQTGHYYPTGTIPREHLVTSVICRCCDTPNTSNKHYETHLGTIAAQPPNPSDVTPPRHLSGKIGELNAPRLKTVGTVGHVGLVGAVQGALAQTGQTAADQSSHRAVDVD